MRVVSVSPTLTAAALQFQSQQQSPLLIKGLFPFTRRGAFSISKRAQICSPLQKLLFFPVKSSVESSSTVDELQDFRFVPSDVSTAEKEEAKAVLAMFLKNETGLNNEAAAAILSKSAPFVDHLVARLHSTHKTRYLVGRELTTLEIRDALIPYLEYLCEEHGGSLDHVMESFRHPSEEEQERYISEASPTKLPLDSKKLKAMTRMSEIGTDEQLPSVTLTLMDMGLDMKQIEQMARKWPSINLPSWERNLKPYIEFLLDIGMPLSNIPNILYKAPQLCSCSISENLIPSMAYLETLGLDKSKWAKVIYSCPHLLSRSRQKVEATVDFLYELGLTRNGIGKVLTRFPQITTCSIDENLRPTAEYFQSMGVNFESLLCSNPQVLGLSVERNLKPTTEFFLDKGYSIDEIGSMASRFGGIYTLSLTKSLIPKWNFFLTMGYPRSDLAKYPNYFGYSLEGRIKPRYAEMMEYGVKLSLSYVFGSSDATFEKFLNRSKKKRFVAKLDTDNVTSDSERK